MKFKLKQDSLTYLDVVLMSGDVKRYYSIDKDFSTAGHLDINRGVDKLEQKVLSKLNFNYAYIVEIVTGNKICYYHHKAGLKRLDKKQYNEIVIPGGNDVYNLYFVPSDKLRFEGVVKGTTLVNIEFSDIPKYWDDSSYKKILCYKNNKLIYEYNGVFAHK